MKLIHSILIRRAPQEVWDFIVDPEHMKLWNKRVEQVTPSEFDHFKSGYRYTITYRMNEHAHATTYRAEFVKFDPPRMLTIRLLAQQPGNAAPEVQEQYALSAQAGGTLLTQTILVEKLRIPLMFRVLIWLISKFGKPVGKPFLAELRDLIEAR